MVAFKARPSQWRFPHPYEMHAREMYTREVHIYAYETRCTPMRHLLMRCTRVRYTLVKCTPKRCTPMRYPHMRCTPPVLNSGKYTGCRSCQIVKSPDALNRPLAETSILAAAAPQPGGFPNNPIANFGVTCQRTLSGRQFHFCQHIPAEVVAFCKKLAYVLLQVTPDKGHRG